jgi:hypothetical protein
MDTAQTGNNLSISTVFHGSQHRTSNKSTGTIIKATADVETECMNFYENKKYCRR